MRGQSLSKPAPSRDQSWKLPRGAYIEELYRKKPRRERPESAPNFSEPPPPAKPW
jgi:hypothetical protein